MFGNKGLPIQLRLAAWKAFFKTRLPFRNMGDFNSRQLENVGCNLPPRIENYTRGNQRRGPQMWHKNELGNPSRFKRVVVAGGHCNKAARALKQNLGQQIGLVAGPFHHFLGPTKRLGNGNPEGLKMACEA